MPKATKARQEEFLREMEEIAGVDAGEAIVDAPKMSFKEFVSKVKPKYQWYHHCNVLAERLEEVVAGKKKRLLVFMPPRHGKPIYNGTMILLEDGSSKPISEIRVDDRVITHKGRGRVVTAIFDQGELPCLRITTETGRSVIAAKDHPFLTPEGWVMAGDLSVGMTLANVPLPETVPDSSRHRTNEEFRLLGYFIGDGNCTPSGAKGTGVNARIVTADKEIQLDLEACATAMGFQVSEKPSRYTGKAIQFAFKGGVRDWLRECGIAGKSSHTKEIPDWVFTASNEQISHFLAAYFGCDGSVNQRSKARKDACVEFYSVNKKLLQQTQHLLLRLGIQSRLSAKNGRYLGEVHHSWRLGITSQDEVAKFKKLVPLIGERSEKLKQWSIYRKTFDTVLLSDHIASIEEVGLKPCRCITVEEDHTYTVNDLVCHNSELVTRMFPAYYLYRHPERYVGINSYAAELAYTFSRAAREAYTDMGGELSGAASAVKHWETGKGGGCWAAGVGGGITGKGFYCFPAGTKVTTRDGLIDIEALHYCSPVPEVLSFDHETNTLEWQRVLASSHTLREKLVEITFKSGHKIQCTHGHPIFIVDSGYTLAASLQAGQKVIRLNSSTGFDFVDSIAEIPHYKRVYDIQVEKNSNFFADSVLVHNCGIIDDPLKNQQDAQSSVIREGQMEWYQSTFYTRAEPEGAIIVVLTRWHELDLAGWLLEQEKKTEEPERWHVVNFPAIAEDFLPQFPDTCTVEHDWRQPGEALCPERFNVSKLLKTKATLGTQIFASLFQQRPTSADGDVFKRDWFKFYTILPASFEQVILSADCAFKGTSTSDFVVIQVWGKNGAEFWLIDQFRARTDINGTISAMRSLTAKHPTASAKIIEDAANGSAVIDLLKRQIPGLIPVKPEGGKQVRAVAAAPYFEAGNVYLPDATIAPWIHDYCEELASFPNGVNDDQVDSTSQSLNWLNQHGGVKFYQSHATWSRSEYDFDL